MIIRKLRSIIFVGLVFVILTSINTLNIKASGANPIVSKEYNKVNDYSDLEDLGVEIVTDSDYWENIGWYKTKVESPYKYDGKSIWPSKWKKRDYGDMEIKVGIYRTIHKENYQKDVYAIIYFVKMMPQAVSSKEIGYSDTLTVTSNLNEKKHQSQEYDLINYNPKNENLVTEYSVNIGYTYGSDGNTGYSITLGKSYEIRNMSIKSETRDEYFKAIHKFNGKSTFSRYESHHVGYMLVEVPESYGLQFKMTFDAKFNDFESVWGSNNEWCYFYSTFDFSYTP